MVDFKKLGRLKDAFSPGLYVLRKTVINPAPDGRKSTLDIRYWKKWSSGLELYIEKVDPCLTSLCIVPKHGYTASWATLLGVPDCFLEHLERIEPRDLREHVRVAGFRMVDVAGGIQRLIDDGVLTYDQIIAAIKAGPKKGEKDP